MLYYSSTAKTVEMTLKKVKKVVDKDLKMWYSNMAVAREQNKNKEPW